MRAILLAAGYGSRLRPLTNTIPKCMVPINGRPLLDIWLSNLSQAGIGPFLVNTHYLSEQVVAYINSSHFAGEVNLVHESSLLGTAGTLIHNAQFFGRDDGMLIHADNFCRADFQEFIKAHHERPSECMMTMMTFRTDTPSLCGIVELDNKGVVVSFYEKVASPPGNLANGAIYILSNEMITILLSEYATATDFSTEILPHFIGKIFTYETQDVFLDIGTPEAYAIANQGEGG